MIVVYRPELCNPPMDKETTFGFSFLAQNGLTDYYSLQAGINREFPEQIWEQIKEYTEVKTLLQLGAIRIETVESEEPVVEASEPLDSIAELAIDKALRLIENSFDLDQLNRWNAKENRIRVKNTIAKRIQAITSGNG